jgi:hypothetical protein
MLTSFNSWKNHTKPEKGAYVPQSNWGEEMTLRQCGTDATACKIECYIQPTKNLNVLTEHEAALLRRRIG